MANDVESDEETTQYEESMGKSFPPWKQHLVATKDSDEAFNPENDSASYSDSASKHQEPNEIKGSTPCLRRSTRIKKPRRTMNLSTWMCCIAAVPQLINDTKTHQRAVLTSQLQDIVTATPDNLVNDMHPFSPQDLPKMKSFI